MFWEWLESVRKKPKTVKNQYAFFGAAAVVSLVAMIWLVSLPGHFAAINVDNSPEKEAAGAFARFFGEAKANLGNVFSSTFQSASSTATTSATSSVDAPPMPQIIIPDLSQSTTEEVQATNSRPNSRPIMIATSSATVATSSQATQ